MKNKLITITIIILIIIVLILGFILFVGKGKYNKNIEKSKQTIQNLKDQIKDLESKPPVTIKEFIKLTNKEKEKAYQKAIDDREKALKIANDSIDQLKKTTKQLEQCNKSLQRKDLILVSGIVGIGLDQEFNVIGQAGVVVSGKVFSGKIFPVKVYLGGGGTYSIRTDFNKTISGGNFIFQTTIAFGK